MKPVSPVRVRIKENYPRKGVSQIDISFPEYFTMDKRIKCADKIFKAIKKSFKEE